VDWFYKKSARKVGPRAHASKGVYSGNRSGWPLRIKGINMASVFKVLPVQPYDIMGSILIE
jgi:hypothetical protein